MLVVVVCLFVCPQNVTQQMTGAGKEEMSKSALLMDTFLISILSPHLYIQSNAVEQGKAREQGGREQGGREGGILTELSIFTFSCCSHPLLAQLQECVQLLAEREKAAERRGNACSPSLINYWSSEKR